MKTYDELYDVIKRAVSDRGYSDGRSDALNEMIPDGDD